MTPTDPSLSSRLVRLDVIVRPEVLDRVVHALRDRGAMRLLVTHGHAIGAGADPDAAKLSLLEGSAFAEVAVVQVVCPDDLASGLTDAVLEVARTGHRGDGIVVESPVGAVTKIRTGETGPGAVQ
jgi:nitrogen regulatory protein PII